MHQITCTKFDFSWGSAPDTAGGAYSAPPDLLARFGGRFAAGGGAGLAKRRERGREGEGGEVGEREGPKLLLNQGHSEPCYATGVELLELLCFPVQRL